MWRTAQQSDLAVARLLKTLLLWLDNFSDLWRWRRRCPSKFFGGSNSGGSPHRLWLSKGALPNHMANSATSVAAALSHPASSFFWREAATVEGEIHGASLSSGSCGSDWWWRSRRSSSCGGSLRSRLWGLVSGLWVLRLGAVLLGLCLVLAIMHIYLVHHVHPLVNRNGRCHAASTDQVALESGCGTPLELGELGRLIPGNISSVALEFSIVG